MLTFRNKIIGAAVIGTLLEWAEYCFYAYSATKIGHLFFPQFDARLGVLAAFGIFALGYVARPLGAVLFGHLGDIYGRKRALTGAILLMGLATLSIGCLPTYAQAGIFAPILLICARLLQGIAVAGEFNGAAIYLFEHSESKSKYLTTSWVSTASAGGMLCGAAIVAVVSMRWMPEWGWRIPFFLGAISCAIGHMIRKNAAESPTFLAFTKNKTRSKLPLLDVIKNHPIPMLKTAALAAFVGINVYTCNIYFTAFLVQNASFTTSKATWIAAFGQASVTLMIPFFAQSADRTNSNRLLIQGLMLAAIAAPLNFLLGSLHLTTLALSGQFLYAVANAMYSATMFKYLCDIFPPHLRYSGITLAWSISVALLGGTAPAMATLLSGYSNYGFSAGLYVSFSAALALMILYTLSPTPSKTPQSIASDS